MRVILLNTGTELLLGDVQDAHLAFIAREILPLGLRIEERRTVGDTEAIRHTLAELFPSCEILFVTGGLGPTSDDITREMVANLLGLELQKSPELLASLRQRLRVRGIKWTSGIARQADVPARAEVLPNQNGSAPGLYLRANINPRIQSPHLFLLPGPPRELQPMFRAFVLPILRSIVPGSALIERRLYRIADKGESLVEEAIGDRVLAVPGIELGYCASPGEVDVRIVGKAKAIEQADAIIRSTLGSSVFSAAGETLEEVVVKLLVQRNQTLAVAESCTGGLLANRITNVPGASAVFLAGFVCYANQAKIDMLDVDPRLIQKHGAVSKQVACALAEHARVCARSNYALATTGVAGPSGGSSEKPVGTVYISLAASGETIANELFFPTDRETFKQIVTQAALELLRRRLIVRPVAPHSLSFRPK
jgi:competence/damage-inducible protein CinA-like protein